MSIMRCWELDVYWSINVQISLRCLKILLKEYLFIVVYQWMKYCIYIIISSQFAKMLAFVHLINIQLHSLLYQTKSNTQFMACWANQSVFKLSATFAFFSILYAEKINRERKLISINYLTGWNTYDIITYSKLLKFNVLINLESEKRNKSKKELTTLDIHG